MILTRYIILEGLLIRNESRILAHIPCRCKNLPSDTNLISDIQNLDQDSCIPCPNMFSSNIFKTLNCVGYHRKSRNKSEKSIWQEKDNKLGTSFFPFLHQKFVNVIIREIVSRLFPGQFVFHFRSVTWLLSFTSFCDGKLLFFAIPI